MIKVAEVMVSKLECTTTTKGNITYGANAFAERACNEHHVPVNALKKLHDQAAEGTSGNMGSSSGSVSSQGTMTTPLKDKFWIWQNYFCLQIKLICTLYK
jgi:hypothetical protein